MSPLDFCHWLKGVLDIHGLNQHLDVEKLKILSSKLEEVFQNIRDAEKAEMTKLPILPYPNIFNPPFPPVKQG